MAVTPEEAVADGRVAAESLMADTLRVTRKSATPVTDPVTGKVTYPSTPIYDGKGRIQARTLEGAESDAGGQRFTVQDFTAQVPADVELRPDDSIEVLTSLDSLNVGRVFSVASVPRKTHMTALRASVEEVTP